MNRATWIFAAVAVLGSWMPASGQVISTVSNRSFFEPEIDIIESGTLLDVQATVSADRKYVTMTMRPQLSTLLSLQTFTFQSGGGATGQVQLPVIGGMVGGVNPAPGGALGVVPAVVNAPVRVAPGAGAALLARRGITPIVRN